MRKLDEHALTTLMTFYREAGVTAAAPLARLMRGELPVIYGSCDGERLVGCLAFDGLEHAYAVGDLSRDLGEMAELLRTMRPACLQGSPRACAQSLHEHTQLDGVFADDFAVYSLLFTTIPAAPGTTISVVDARDFTTLQALSALYRVTHDEVCTPEQLSVLAGARGSVLYAARCEHVLCGMACMDSVTPRYGLLSHLGVFPAFRGRRIADMLAATAVLGVRQAGKLPIALIGHSNLPSRRALTRYGEQRLSDDVFMVWYR